MNIRPRNIQKYQGGGTFNLADWIAQNPTYYEWYKGIYPNAQVLAGNPLKQNQAHANYSKISSSHHTTDDLQRSAYNNYLYTSPDQYTARESDIINWATKNNIDLNTVSDEDFVNTYNRQAQTIRDAREAPQTYNRTGYSGTNQTFRNMFGSRSQQGTNHPLYNIGYQENIEDIEGTSTWQRRMDRYEKRFQDDTPENQKNRTFYITRPDGRKIKVYKKENGDLGLFNDPNDPNSPKDPNPENPQNPEPGKVDVVDRNPGRVPVGLGDWDKKNILSNFDWKNIVPGALNIGRLQNTLNTNKKVYGHMKKAIFPVLQQSYHTHRQVVGDEATKQAHYTRAAEGQTKAARPFTSDADRQMAYQMEAKRVSDQLRAEGDRADNAEIRRTSDEAMQHAWQNVARDTEVANQNIVSIAKARAAKHQLDAQQASALGTSLDNWLKEIQYNFSKRRQEEIAYQNQLDQYDMAYSRLNDKDREQLEKAYYNAEEAYAKSKSQADYNKVLETSKALKAYDLNWMKQWQINHKPQYSSTYFFGKRGGKFDHDAELLYKVSRDAVKHFREMSKQTDDSRIKTLPKAVRLKGVPKSSSRKYQYGGQAPFMVYTPLALGGGEGTTASASTSTKSSSGDKKDKHDTFDVVKDLFKEIAGKGLPSDVSVAYDQMSALLRRVQVSGDSMDSDDLASMYLKQMQIVNNLQFEKAAYDKAKENVTNNKGLGEIAVDSFGRIIGQGEDGKLKRMTLSEMQNSKESFTPFTNEQLLQYRAYSPNKAFDQEILQIVNNGVGLEKVAEYIKAHINSIGTDEFQQEGYSKKEAQQIMSGIQALQQASEQGLAMAPDGTYKGEYLTKTQERQMQLAINYLKRILPENMKTVLAIHGGSVEQAITEAVVSRGSEVRHYGFDAVTGKATKDANGDAKSEENMKSNPLIQMLKEQGGVPRTYELITRDGKSKMSVDGTFYSTLPKIKEETSLDNMLTESGIRGITDSVYGITFGDQTIDPANLKDVMCANTGGQIATLPCKIVNGHKVVNLQIKDLYDEAVQEADNTGYSRNSKQYQDTLVRALESRNLNNLIGPDGKLDRTKFGQFLLVEGYATTKVPGLDKSSQYIEKIKDPDQNLEDRLIRALSTDKKKLDYSLDVNYYFYGDDVYRGTIFIPLNNNVNSAVNAWGQTAKLDEVQEQEEYYQNFNKASKTKPAESNYLL